MRILLVDTLPHTEDSLKNFLRLQEDIEIVGEATTGNEALRLSRILQPDIVIININLPNGSGFETAWEIHSRPDAPAMILLAAHFNKCYLPEKYHVDRVLYVEKDAGVNPVLEAIHMLYTG